MPARALVSTVICLVGLLVFAASAMALTPLAPQMRVSDQLPDGISPTSFPTAPAVVGNAAGDGYLAAWAGVFGGEIEVAVRRLDAEGVPLSASSRATNTGPAGDDAYSAITPALAHNGRQNEYLLVWAADDDSGSLVDDEFEIYAQRLDAAGTPLGAAVRVSTSGPDGDTNFVARNPSVAYNSVDNRYLVAWGADDDSGPLVDDEFEIYARLLDASATPVGAQARVSTMGTDGDTALTARLPRVAYSESINEFTVVWEGDGDTGTLVDDEFEIFAQRLSGAMVPIGSRVQVSAMGPNGDAAYDAAAPSITTHDARGEFLVVWSASDNAGALVPDEFEIYGQRLTLAGAHIGGPKRYTTTGADGDTTPAATTPRVVYNPTANEYLLAWVATPGVAPLSAGEAEVYAMRLRSDANPLSDAVRVSSMGPDGSAAYAAAQPVIVASAPRNSYLAVWRGDDDTPPLVNDELEIFARWLGGGPSNRVLGPVCADVPEPTVGAPTGTPTLSAAQLRINQRIGAAAVRRANAISDWIDAGITNADICSGALTPETLNDDFRTYVNPLRPEGAAPTPRPLQIAPAGAADGTAQLTGGQMLINQRIYAAAIRRAAALDERLGRLTGGDVVDGSIARDRLRRDVAILTTSSLVAPLPPSSLTIPTVQRASGTAKPTLTQLRINQRIAVAAVRRVNALRWRLARGLTADNFVADALSPGDFAPVAAATQSATPPHVVIAAP